MVPTFKTERAEWTASGKDETRFDYATAKLVIQEPERTVATVLYAGRALFTKVEPAHEDVKFFTVYSYNVARMAEIWPTLTFEFEEVYA
jgi:hypothetical protein